MIHVDLADAISGLDDELLDDYLTRRAENLKRLRRRRAWFKGLLSTAACLLVVLSVTAKVRFDRLYPYIPLENSVGDISVRYVPEWMVEGEFNNWLPNYSEVDLFNKADYVFLGTITRIDHIVIDFNGQTLYREIISVKIESSYKGNPNGTIRILTQPTKRVPNASDTLLQMLSINTYGLFIVPSVTENDFVTYNNCSLQISDLADAYIFDSYGFALINDGNNNIICYDNIHSHPNMLFESLPNYRWNCIPDYINILMNKT